jgi:autotransporter-associated beta strand protein
MKTSTFRSFSSSPRLFRPSTGWGTSLPGLLAAGALMLACGGSAQAASGTWTGAVDQIWNTDGNWSGGSFPGSATGTTNEDTATFAAGGANTLYVTGTVNLKNIEFLSTSPGRSINLGTLSITSGGLISTEFGAGYVNIFSNLILNGTGVTVNNATGFGLIGTISGEGGLTHTGTAGLQISQNHATSLNTYTGATRFEGRGTVYFFRMADGGQASSFGASSSEASNLTFNSGYDLKYIGNGDSSDRAFTINTEGTFAWSANGSGALRMTSHEAIAFATPDFNFTLRFLGTSKHDNEFGLSIRDNGTGTTSVDKFDNGKMILTGDNTYTGITDIWGGILAVHHNNALGSTFRGTTIRSGATLQLDNNVTIGAEALNIGGAGTADQNGALVNTGGNNEYGGAITLSAATQFSVDAGTLYLSNTTAITGSGYSLTLTGAGEGTLAAGLATGAGSLIKNGTGTWRLTGSSSYSGGTVINQGTLLVNATDGTGSGSVSVGADGTLGGVGVIRPGLGQSLTIAGTVAAGDPNQSGGIGTLGIDGANTSEAVANFASSATFVFDINATVGTSDRIQLLNGAAGDLVFNDNTLTLSITGILTDGQTFLLFEGTDSNQFAGLTVDGDFRILSGLSLTGLHENYLNSYLTLENGHIILNVVAVPEPTTALLLVATGAFLLRRRTLR